MTASDVSHSRLHCWSLSWIASLMVTSCQRSGEPSQQAASAASLPVHWQDQTQAGWLSSNPDPAQPAAMFDVVFASLPDEVLVRPSENYLYWQLPFAGREWRGNFRLPPIERAAGDLHFAYSEWQEFPSADRSERPKGRHSVRCLKQGKDAWNYLAQHQGKTVHFRLLPLDQSPPQKIALHPGESFVQRTEDESGLPFLLIFDQTKRDFRWLLDEERPVPEHWRELAPTILQGRRSGFVFLREADGRKVLRAIRQASADRNDAYDGPFDQLADNYAAETKIKEWLIRWKPELDGHIDQFGNYLPPETGRVAIAAYEFYTTEDEAKEKAMKP